eukprot:scaffold1519_cov166-Amphora_coffeaeformis.AAC.10
MDRLLESDNPSLQAFFTKAELQIDLGEGAAAVETMEALWKEDKRRKEHPLLKLIQETDDAEARGDRAEVERLKEATVKMFEEIGGPPTRLSPSTMFRVHALQSKAYQLKKEWSMAFDCLVRALGCIDEPESHSAVDLRKV